MPAIYFSDPSVIRWKTLVSNGNSVQHLVFHFSRLWSTNTSDHWSLVFHICIDTSVRIPVLAFRVWFLTLIIRWNCDSRAKPSEKCNKKSNTNLNLNSFQVHIVLSITVFELRFSSSHKIECFATTLLIARLDSSYEWSENLLAFLWSYLWFDAFNA